MLLLIFQFCGFYFLIIDCCFYSFLNIFFMDVVVLSSKASSYVKESGKRRRAAPEKVKGRVARCVIARKCWSCGQGDHVARDCRRRRCWQCRRYGHMKKDCQEGRYRREFLLPAPLSASENKIIKDKARVCSMLSEKGELSCEAYVKAVRTNALIDTGAAVSLIRSEIVTSLKN